MYKLLSKINGPADLKKERAVEWFRGNGYVQNR